MGALLADLTTSPVPQNLLVNQLWVAVIALVHQQIATFLTGASTLALVSESIAVSRNDPRHARLSEGIVRSMAYIFSFGAALPIFWVTFVLLGLWGTFFIALTRVTFWVFVLEAGFFLVEIVLLYGLYANWQRLGGYRTARLGLLALLNVALFWQMFFIDVVASYMLTPNGGDRSQLAQLLNPTNLPLTLHRTIGNIAWAGALVAGFAAVRYRRACRHEERLAATTGGSLATADAPPPGPPRSVGAMSATWFGDGGQADGAPRPRPGTRPGDRAFYDFVVQWGVLFAIGLTLFQPWVGYSYAKEIQLHAYPAWEEMMWGDLSNVFLAQITLLGLIFTLGALFFWRRLRASGAVGQTNARLAFLCLAATTVFAAIPARFAWTLTDIQQAGLDRPWWEGGLDNPIGTFIPNKVVALLLFMLFGMWALVTYLVAVSREQLRWGQATPASARIALGLTVTVSLMMAVMGIIREHSRQPFLVTGEITIRGQHIEGGQLAQPGAANPRSLPEATPAPGVSPAPPPP